jgi:hypothetical protein
VGTVGGPRHYTGADRVTRTPWICPTCRTQNTSLIEAGCPACGAGTPAQAEEARQRMLPETSRARVVEAVCGPEAQAVSPDYWLDLSFFTPQARITLAAALMFYAEHGSPSSEELPRAVITRWAKDLFTETPAPEPAAQTEEPPDDRSDPDPAAR